MKRVKRIAGRACAPSVVVLSLAASLMAAGPVQAKNCHLLGQVRASESEQPITITFVNSSGMFRHIDWIDFDGNPEQRASLNPGQTHVQQTTSGSPWMVSDGPGNCVDIFMPKKSRTINLR